MWEFTEQGLKSLKDCVQSIEIFKGYTERIGNPYHGTFYSFGKYGAVSLLEATDENTVRYAVLQAEQSGNLRSLTLKCITHDEAVKLAESISS